MSLHSWGEISKKRLEYSTLRKRTQTAFIVGKGKGNVHPRTDHEDPEGKQRCSSTLSLTSSLDGIGLSTPRPGRLTPGKEPLPIIQDAGWAPGLVWTGAENLALTGVRSPDRPARSESLYRLNYPGSPSKWVSFLILQSHWSNLPPNNNSSTHNSPLLEEWLSQQADIRGQELYCGNYLFTTDTKQIHVSKFYCPSMQSPALCTTRCQ